MASDDKKNVIPSGARERCGRVVRCTIFVPPTHTASSLRSERQRRRTAMASDDKKNVIPSGARERCGRVGTLHDIRAAHPHRFLATLGMTAPKDSNGVR